LLTIDFEKVLGRPPFPHESSTVFLDIFASGRAFLQNCICKFWNIKICICEFHDVLLGDFRNLATLLINANEATVNFTVVSQIIRDKVAKLTDDQKKQLDEYFQ